jgi:hypothetical protein
MRLKMESTLSLSDYCEDDDGADNSADVLDDAADDVDAAGKAALNDIYGALKGRPFDPDDIKIVSVDFVEFDSTNPGHGNAYFLVVFDIPAALAEVVLGDERLGAKRLPPTPIGG